MAQITFQINGDLLSENLPSMRTVATITGSLQGALNRAYLEVKYGSVFKNQRTSRYDYEEFDFWFSGIKAGSFIADFISHSPVGEAITGRIVTILDPVYRAISAGVDREYFDKAMYVEMWQKSLHSEKSRKIKTFAELKRNPPKDISSGYSEKSITANISKAVSPLRSTVVQDSSITFIVKNNDSTQNYFFNKDRAISIGHYATRKSAAEPVIYRAKIYEMDESKNTALFNNLDNKLIRQRLVFKDAESFNEARDYFGKEEVFFVGIPYIESGSLDLNAGDVLFVEVTS